MWYPARVQTAAESEPVTLEEIKQHVLVDSTDSDPKLIKLIATARDHAERMCGIRIVEQTLDVKCDSFEDFWWLPEGPVKSITSVTYTDVEGASQTLATSVYELRADEMDAAIVLKSNQSWPPIQYGSRITVRMVCGFNDVPASIHHGICLFVASNFTERNDRPLGDFSLLDAMLMNFRRNS